MFRRKHRNTNQRQEAVREASDRCVIQVGAAFVVAMIASWLLGQLAFRAELFAFQFTLSFVLITLICHFRFGPMAPTFCLCCYLFFREPALNSRYSPVLVLAVAALCLALCGAMYRCRILLQIEEVRLLPTLRAFPRVVAATGVTTAEKIEAVRGLLFWTIISALLASLLAAVILTCVPLTTDAIQRFRLQPPALRLIILGFVLTFTFVLIRFFTQQFLWRRKGVAAARVYVVSSFAQWLYPDTRMVHRRMAKMKRLRSQKSGTKVPDNNIKINKRKN